MFKGLKKFSALEIIVFILFFIYLIFDFKTPSYINNLIDTPLGIVVILLCVLVIFLCLNPILGILGIFVAYEIIRRSSVSMHRPAVFDYKPVNISRDFDLNDQSAIELPSETEQKDMETSVEVEMTHQPTVDTPLTHMQGANSRELTASHETVNTAKFESSLEEELVHKMAPISMTNIDNKYIVSDFKPISENVHNASVV